MGEPVDLPLEWLVGFASVFGAVIGSFLNVVVHRLPEGVSLITPRSRCPSCRTPIAAWDNLPVLSWLLLRGRCRSCRHPISPRYPAVELATALLFAALAWRYGLGWMTPLWMLFAAALIAAALIDYDHRIIPDEISLGGLGVGLLAAPALAALEGAPYSRALATACWGAGIGGGLLWIVGFVHARVSVGLGRSFEHWPGEGEAPPRPGQLDYWVWFPGLGFGDVKLLAMIGAFVGPWGVLETLLVAAFAGLGIGLLTALATRRFDSPFGFGPAIALGAIAGLLSPWHFIVPL